MPEALKNVFAIKIKAASYRVETSAKVSLAFFSRQNVAQGALACDKMRYGQPRAAVLHQDFAEVSSCVSRDRMVNYRLYCESAMASGGQMHLEEGNYFFISLGTGG
jgi:hypothetical protein